MQYLDQGCIETLSHDTFRKQQPYPWVSIPTAVTQESFERLRNTLPQVELFNRKAGVKRGHGQAPHDRYILHYKPGMQYELEWNGRFEFGEDAQNYGFHYVTRGMHPPDLSRGTALLPRKGGSVNKEMQ